VVAGLGALAAIFTEQWTLLRIRVGYRDHVVVCGAGRVGMRLATTLRDSGMQVVAVDHGPTVADVEECRRHRVPMVVGDATDPVVLHRARVHRARHLIAVSGDDGVNAEVALLATALVEDRPLTCLVNVDDEELSVMLDQTVAFDRSDLRYRFFNIFRQGPKAVIDGEDLLRLEDDGSAPHLLVVGGGPIGTNFVLEAVHQWELRRDEIAESGDEIPRLRITLVDPDAPSRVQKIRQRHPRLDKGCDLEALEMDPWDSYSRSFALEGAAFSRAVVCPVDDASGLRACIMLRRSLGRHLRVVVCTTGRHDTAPLLDLANLGDGVTKFPVLDEVCRRWVDLVLMRPDLIESLARRVHTFYVRHRRDDGDEPAPSMVPWDMLPVDLQESNREQARDFKRKIEAIGYTIAPAVDGAVTPFRFSDEELDALARMEHSRWLREKVAAGWRHIDGPQDRKAKLHPDLVCWGCLGEAEREKDVRAVTDFPEALVLEGYTVVPREGGPVPSASRDDTGGGSDLLATPFTCPRCGQAADVATGRPGSPGSRLAAGPTGGS